MTTAIDSVLLVGFGGPTPGCCKTFDPCPGEAYCFAHRVLPEGPTREARAKEVAAHYQHFGGFSPYNELTFEQARALEKALAERGHPLPVVAGFKNWRPLLKDALEDLRARGLSRPFAIILAPHQSAVSWEKYITAVAEARAAIGASAPEIAGWLDPFWKHPGFVGACAARIREQTAGWSRERFDAAALVFSAHSIPVPAARSSPYVGQIEETARLVAEKLGHPEHRVAFQSAPAESRVPWVGPMVPEVLAELAAQKRRDAIVAPIGFLCDHVEVLYDLDIDARERAAKLGLGFFRAATVMSHPEFVGMLADGVVAHLG